MKAGKLIRILLVLPFVSTMGLIAMPEKEETKEQSLTICCSPELMELGSQWADGFTALHPEANIQVLRLAEAGQGGLIGDEGHMALLLKTDLSKIEDGQNRIFSVGKDVIVPVMSEKHPRNEEIRKHGISPGILSSGFAAEASLRSVLAEFLQIDVDQLQGEKTGTLNETLNYIQNHPETIAFCKLAEVLEGEALLQGLSLVPIDINGNQTLDPLENIYKSPLDLLRGIWIGKYPRALYSKLYAITDPGQLNSVEEAFLSWMLTDGQEELSALNFIPVSKNESYALAQQLAKVPAKVPDIHTAGSSVSSSLIILGILGILFLSIFWVPRLLARQKTPVDSGTDSSESVPGLSVANFPRGLLFDKSHTWAYMEKDGKVMVGINDFLQKVTGPITRVNLKQAGERVQKGEPFITLVQDGKKLEIQSPVSGIVEEQNQKLIKDSSLMNAAPYAEGWMYRIEPANWLKEMKAYVMGEQYSNWIRQELVRLKEFLSSGITISGKTEAMPVMQDGGEISEGVLEGFGPEVWEEFQTSFINVKS